MFARTPRLLLRPGFPEDAQALTAAIGDEAIVRNLTGPPWPFRIRDAEAYLARARDPLLPCLVILLRTEGAPRLIGECGLARRPSGAVEMGYWISRSSWGQGFATEACRALIDIARAIGLRRLEGSHFVDNPASARVLAKLGFEATGLTAPRMSCARGEQVPARLMRLELGEGAGETECEALAA